MSCIVKPSYLYLIVLENMYLGFCVCFSLCFSIMLPFLTGPPPPPPASCRNPEVPCSGDAQGQTETRADEPKRLVDTRHPEGLFVQGYPPPKKKRATQPQMSGRDLVRTLGSQNIHCVKGTLGGSRESSIPTGELGFCPQHCFEGKAMDTQPSFGLRAIRLFGYEFYWGTASKVSEQLVDLQRPE